MGHCIRDIDVLYLPFYLAVVPIDSSFIFLLFGTFSEALEEA